MLEPIEIDLTGLKSQFNLTNEIIDKMTETCVDLVTSAIYYQWENLAKEKLKSTLPTYLQNLNIIDKGRFAKQIVLTGKFPEMIENGAAPFDMKEGFKNSKYVKYTVPVYNKRGRMISPGGQWYLTIPFRQGTPGIIGQAGFANEMPQEIYDVIKQKPSNSPLKSSEIPSPYDVPQSRAAIIDEKTKSTVYEEYIHKSSIYEGLTKVAAAYEKTTQNTYMSFRRVGANSDPLAFIHKGLIAQHFANKAIQQINVDTIVENQVKMFLDKIL